MRKAVFSASFYPEQSDQLSDQIDYFLQHVSLSKNNNTVKGGICPHAGYMYSGKTASYLMKNFENSDIETVVILGPSHRFSFYGASINDEDAYATPLGLVPIEEEVSKKIRDESSYFSSTRQAHQQEHSIEVLLPFLQKTLKSFKLVPIIIGAYDKTLINALVQAIHKHCDKNKTLILASSDFSHFYEGSVAEKMDAEAVDHICHWDTESLVKRSEDLSIQMCGLAPILVTMDVLKGWGCKTAEQLFYEHSGQISGDLSSVVGYHAVSFY